MSSTCTLIGYTISLLRCLGMPYLTTLHGRLDMPQLSLSFEHFAASPFVSISGAQRGGLSGVCRAGTVLRGLPADSLRPCDESDGYLAFLGRVAPEKGPDAAIRVAHAAGVPLKIAAKVGRNGPPSTGARLCLAARLLGL
jgi:hypothetical protein